MMVILQCQRFSGYIYNIGKYWLSAIIAILVLDNDWPKCSYQCIPGEKTFNELVSL